MIRPQTQNAWPSPGSRDGVGPARERSEGIRRPRLVQPLARASVVFALLLAGCGGSEERPIYAESPETQPIRVPPGLDQPETEAALRIPGDSAPELAGLREGATPPQVLPSAEADNTSSSVRYGVEMGALYLRVDDRPASVWHRLGFTLDRRDMTLQRSDESAQTYEFSYTQPSRAEGEGGFWDTILFWRGSDSEDYSGVYRVRLRPDNDQPEATRVYLFRGDGSAAAPAAADHLLGVIRQRLG